MWIAATRLSRPRSLSSDPAPTSLRRQFAKQMPFAHAQIASLTAQQTPPAAFTIPRTRSRAVSSKIRGQKFTVLNILEHGTSRGIQNQRDENEKWIDKRVSERDPFGALELPKSVEAVYREVRKVEKLYGTTQEFLCFFF